MIQRKICSSYGFWIDQDGVVLPFCFFQDENNREITTLNQINQFVLKYDWIDPIVYKVEEVIKGELCEYELSTNSVEFIINKEITNLLNDKSITLVNKKLVINYEKNNN